MSEYIFLLAIFLNDPYEGGWKKTESLAFLLMSNMDDYLDKAGKLCSIVDNTRFTSFTKCYKNELLWAHYAGGFSGVCFEYDVPKKEHDIRHIKK